MKFKTPICFVLGAGFSRAFDSNSPLINIRNSELDIPKLLRKYSRFKNIKKILSSAIDKQDNVNIESLLSRLYAGMPYDEGLLKDGERQLLYNDIRENFFQLVQNIKLQEDKEEELDKFAKFVISKNASCITLNYDTLLDKALFEVNPIYSANPPIDKEYWHSDGGYGFFCRDEASVVEDTQQFKDRTTILLLKLHGSISWRIKRGYKKPYPIDSLVHSEDWYNPPQRQSGPLTESERNVHLEEFPFIVPPILIKSELTEEHVLKIVWSEAYKKLTEAKTIIFIGYSLPKTDIATSFLLKEGIAINSKKYVKNLIVVNTSGQEKEKKEPYNNLFPTKNLEFIFDGGLKWIKDNLS